MISWTLAAATLFPPLPLRFPCPAPVSCSVSINGLLHKGFVSVDCVPDQRLEEIEAIHVTPDDLVRKSRLRDQPEPVWQMTVVDPDERRRIGTCPRKPLAQTMVSERLVVPTGQVDEC